MYYAKLFFSFKSKIREWQQKVGKRKENHLGQLTERDTNPTPKLLPSIFLSAQPQFDRKLGKRWAWLIGPGVRWKMAHLLSSVILQGQENTY